MGGIRDGHIRPLVHRMVLRLLEKVEKTVYLLRSMILTSMAPAKHLLKSFSSELAEVKPSIDRGLAIAWPSAAKSRAFGLTRVRTLGTH